MEKITTTDFKHIGYEWINQHKYFPKFMKREARNIWDRHLNLFFKEVGVIELCYRRTKDDKGKIGVKNEKNG